MSLDVVIVPGVIKRNQKVKNNIQCPKCGDVANLVSDLNHIYVTKIQSSVLVKFLSYQCDCCEESFTTTETDELNVLEIDKSISKFKRKITISNILK